MTTRHIDRADEGRRLIFTGATLDGRRLDVEGIVRLVDNVPARGDGRGPRRAHLHLVVEVDGGDRLTLNVTPEAFTRYGRLAADAPRPRYSVRCLTGRAKPHAVIDSRTESLAGEHRHLAKAAVHAAILNANGGASVVEILDEAASLAEATT